MDRVHLTATDSPDGLQGVGVGLYKGARHIGILCRNSSDKRLRFIHLAFHEDLRVEEELSKCAVWIEAKLEEEQARVVAAQARLIYQKHQSGGIPYGFSPYGGYFGAKGEIRWSAPGNGLTCATFVLAVFDRGGVRLVLGETWPVNRPEDIEFQRKMIDSMQSQTDATQAHLKGVKKDIGQVRFRPDEVAGAIAAESYPSDFNTAENIGNQIKKLLQT